MPRTLPAALRARTYGGAFAVKRGLQVTPPVTPSRPTPRWRMAKEILLSSSERGRIWSGRPDLNGRPPEPHRRGNRYSGVRRCLRAPLLCLKSPNLVRVTPLLFADVQARNCPRNCPPLQNMLAASLPYRGPFRWSAPFRFPAGMPGHRYEKLTPRSRGESANERVLRSWPNTHCSSGLARGDHVEQARNQ
jgi:hypothetical protein